MDIHEMNHILRKEQDKKRYEHTQGVMYMSAALCMRYGIDMNKGMLAGLLHDCAKCYKVKEQYALCKKHHIKLSDYEEENPSLIHAKLGSYLAETIYKVHDKDILSAIMYHTTGRPAMTTLEKIIYIADYIEPHRELPRVDEMRSLAFQNLDQTIYELAEMTLEHLSHDDKVIDASTIATYEYYKV